MIAVTYFKDVTFIMSFMSHTPIFKILLGRNSPENNYYSI